MHSTRQWPRRIDTDHYEDTKRNQQPTSIKCTFSALKHRYVRLDALILTLKARSSSHPSASHLGNGPTRKDSPAATPYVTGTSMIAPSPDWCVGVSGVSLRNADGTWKVRGSCCPCHFVAIFLVLRLGSY